MRLKPKQSCVECHFFVKKIINSRLSHEIKASERESVRQRDYSWVAIPSSSVWLACYFGVWDEERNKFVQNELHQLIVETDQRDFCFWWKYHPAMHPQPASILQEREAKNRDAAHDRRLTRIGLWIAAIALVANAVLKLVELFR